MNRRKSDPRTPVSVYLALVAAAMIAAGGGVMHVIYKNQQILVAREIDKTERHIEQCQLEIRTTQYRMDELLNRFVIRQQLEENASVLRSIPIGLIEEVDPARPVRDSVAGTVP